MACRLPGSPKPKHALVDDRHNRRWSTLPMGHYLAMHICPPPTSKSQSPLVPQVLVRTSSASLCRSINISHTFIRVFLKFELLCILLVAGKEGI